MKNIIFLYVLSLFVFSCNSGSNQDSGNYGDEGNGALSNLVDSMSYAIGGIYSKQFKYQGVEVLIPEMTRGLKEGMNGKSYMDQATIQSIVFSYRRGVVNKHGSPYTPDDPLTANLDSLSYATGADLGVQLLEYEVDFNPSAFERGAQDVYKEEGATQFNDSQDQAMLNVFTREIMTKRKAIYEAKAAVNKEEGENFIAEKSKEAGVKSTPSGLHYKVLKEGSGPMPKVTDMVKVHYHGTLIDGTVFDSSVDKGKPAEFRLDGVIKGWTEGLQLMKLRSKYRFYIPAELAYGKNGSGALIGPDATLIFDVELLEIK